MIDDEVALMDILFISGPRLYTAMLEQMARQGETFLLTYSITSRDSLLAVRQDYELGGSSLEVSARESVDEVFDAAIRA